MQIKLHVELSLQMKIQLMLPGPTFSVLLNRFTMANYYSCTDFLAAKGDE